MNRIMVLTVICLSLILTGATENHACFDDDPEVVREALRLLNIEVVDCPNGLVAPVLNATVHCGTYSGTAKQLKKSLKRASRSWSEKELNALVETLFDDDMFTSRFIYHAHPLQLQWDAESKAVIVYRYSMLPAETLQAPAVNRRCHKDMVRPELNYKEEIHIPRAGSIKDLDGTMILVEALIDTGGNVRTPVVLYSRKSGPIQMRLSKSVLAGVSKWRYKPATINGESANATLLIKYTISAKLQ